jgi:hypothetical protein
MEEVAEMRNKIILRGATLSQEKLTEYISRSDMLNLSVPRRRL